MKLMKLGTMKLQQLAVVTSALLAVGLASENVIGGRSYTGHTVLRAQVQDRTQAEALYTLKETGNYDFWTEVKLEVSLKLNLYTCII